MSIFITESERAALVAEGVELGHSTQDMNLAMDRLVAAANRLQSERDAAALANAQALLDAMTTHRNRVLVGRMFVNNNMPAGVNKVATLAAIDHELVDIQRKIVKLQRLVADLS